MSSGSTNTIRRTEPVQLRLLGAEGSWLLDEATKRIGREGLAKARAILAERHGADHAALAA